MARKVFRPASFENIRNRDNQDNPTRAKVLYENAEQAIPGVLKRLKREFRENILVQTAIAYGDSSTVENLLGIASGSMRNLKWCGVWTDAETFIKQCRLIDRYNDFTIDRVEQIVNHFPTKEFRLRRDGSVVVNIGPVTEEEYIAMGCGGRGSRFGEYITGREAGDILMIRWD